MSWRRSSVPPQAQIAAEHEVRRLRALLNATTVERDSALERVRRLEALLFPPAKERA